MKKHTIFTKTMWFQKRLKFDIDFFDFLQPQRKISKKAPYDYGMFYSEKCKRNIQHESGLERKFIEQLEKDDNVIFYFEQPIRITYWRGRKKRFLHTRFRSIS